MYPHTHFLFPFFIAAIMAKLEVFSWELAVLAGVIGVVVDIDHYVEHILHTKKNRFSFIATWNNSIKYHKFNQRSFIHYWDGALVITAILVLLSFINWQLALVIAIGYYSHLFLDWSHITKGKSWKIKLGDMYVHEKYSELILDGLLVVGILFTIFI